MVDLKGQYGKIKHAIDTAVLECIENGIFINGPEVKKFSNELAEFFNIKYVTPCANGTDALQIAMMALGLEPGDEVIVPAFTYVATAEVLGLLGLVPVMVDVDEHTFNITTGLIEQAISPKTRAIVPVHLFGQCADMEPIMQLAHKYQLFVIEDTAQAIGAVYTDSLGHEMKAGTMGDIGCTSFFPSKNLGCYGDGGAMYTNNADLGQKLTMLANHGQVEKYVHKYIGVNSRLDSIQAAILRVKLPLLDEYSSSRRAAADYYDNGLKDIPELRIPVRLSASTHVFHQYTLVIENGKRDALKKYLASKGIPTMIYYPIPLNEQEAFAHIGKTRGSLAVTEFLCKSVLSLPMHTELTIPKQDFIIESIREFLKR